MWSEAIPTNSLTKMELTWPLIGTPVGNGVRYKTDFTGTPCNITGESCVNDYVREQIIEYGMDGLDGHIQVEGGGSPAEGVFALAEKKGEPRFEFFVQDVAATGKMYKDRCNLYDVLPKPYPPWLVLAKPVTLCDPEGAEAYWKQMCLVGHAGINLKTAGCMYNEGMTSWNFMEHMVYSKWQQGVAKAVGFTAEGNTLRYITCVDPETERTFNVEYGFTPKQRADFWKDHQVFTNFTVRYEYQDLGTDVPLHARFKKLSKR
jgi:hypothetical protein